MKKLLSWILLACLLVCAVPVSTVANSDPAPTPTPPTITEAPADAIPITDLSSLMLSETDRGSYKLMNDLHVTLDMVDEYYADPLDPSAKVTHVKDENGDTVYVTADGKIAYDKTNGSPKADTAEGATGNVKDANGDDVYYTAEGKIAYDTVNGSIKRAYAFTSALISSTKTDKDEIWEANKKGLSFYGGGHTITFEDGITFAGCAVFVNKVYGAFSVYDLNLGSPENGVEMVIASMANVAILCGGTVDYKRGEELLEASLYTNNVNLYGSIDETARGADNNVVGFCAKPDDNTECTFINSNSYVDIFRTKTKTNATRTANYAGFVGTWQGAALVIENCNNYGTMYGEMNASKDENGGVAGFVATTTHNTTEGSTVVLRNCVNYGTMIGARLAAGLIACSTLETTIENCVNRGEIIQYDPGESTLATAAAGLIARVSAGSVVLTGCANESSKISIVSPSATAVSAGLVGLTYDAEKVTFNNCFSFTSADVSMVKGAAIRFDTPTKLRFRAVLSESLATMIAEKYGEGRYKIGMKIAKLADYEAAGGFDNLAADKVIEREGTWFDDAKTTFVATTDEIGEADYATQYIAVAYVTLIDAQGVESTVYSTITSEHARSVSYVAKAVLEDRMPVAIEIKGYVFEISPGSFSQFTTEGNEKLKGFVVEDNAQ